MPCMLYAEAGVSSSASGVFDVLGIETYALWSWTPSAMLYVSDATAGLITATEPVGTGDYIECIGYAVTATTIYFNPNLVMVVHN